MMFEKWQNIVIYIPFKTENFYKNFFIKIINKIARMPWWPLCVYYIYQIIIIWQRHKVFSFFFTVIVIYTYNIPSSVQNHF